MISPKWTLDFSISSRGSGGPNADAPEVGLDRRHAVGDARDIPVRADEHPLARFEAVGVADLAVGVAEVAAGGADQVDVQAGPRRGRRLAVGLVAEQGPVRALEKAEQPGGQAARAGDGCVRGAVA